MHIQDQFTLEQTSCNFTAKLMTNRQSFHRSGIYPYSHAKKYIESSKVEVVLQAYVDGL